MGDTSMYERHSYRQPEETASTGLPIGVMLLSVIAIAVYLSLEAKFSEPQREAKRAADASHPSGYRFSVLDAQDITFPGAFPGWTVLDVRSAKAWLRTLLPGRV